VLADQREVVARAQSNVGIEQRQRIASAEMSL
jgi:hypothetical protein